jgi:chromosome segregation ATPase
MNQQQPDPNLPTLPEIGERWGIVYNQVLAANIVLEKRLHAQAETIRTLTARETGMAETIEDLEAEIASLKAEQQRADIAEEQQRAEFVAKIHDLEEQLKSFDNLAGKAVIDEGDPD